MLNRHPTTSHMRWASRSQEDAVVDGRRQPSATAAVGRVKPIEEVEVGDLVWAWDGNQGALVKRRVKRLFRRKDRPVLQVHCIDQAATVQVITATTEHPFWIEGRGWVAAHALQAGEVLKCVDGASRMSVLRVKDIGTRADVFNFEVEEAHNYFVGRTGVLVHNESVRPGAVAVPEAMAAMVGELSREVPNTRGMNAYPSQLDGAATLNPAKEFVLTETGSRPRLDYTQSARFDIGGRKVTIVGVGEIAGAVAEGPDTIVASRNFSSCASVSVKGTRDGRTFLMQGHFTAEPGGTQTQHGNVARFLDNLPKGFAPEQVVIAVDGFNRDVGALDPGALPQIAPMLTIRSARPGSDAYRNVYVNSEGVLVETFNGRNQQAGAVGAFEFTPWD